MWLLWVLSDTDPVLGNEIIAGDCRGYIRVRGDDYLSLLESTAQTVVLVMAFQPSISMIAVTQETEIINFDHSDIVLVSVLSHLYYNLSQNYIIFVPLAILTGNETCT